MERKRMRKKEREREKDSRFFLSFTIFKQTACEQMVNDLSFTLSLKRTKRMKQTDSQELLLVSTVVDVRINSKSTLE